MKDDLESFLREVACVPLAVDEIGGIGRREYSRAMWFELLHATRNRGLAAPALPADASEQVRAHARDEEALHQLPATRAVVEPAGMAAALHLADGGLPRARWFPRRVAAWPGGRGSVEDGVSYAPPPDQSCPSSTPPTPATRARDPGAKALHYQQLALAWRDPRRCARRCWGFGATRTWRSSTTRR